MFTTTRAELQTELDEIRAAGLYKTGARSRDAAERSRPGG